MDQQIGSQGPGVRLLRMGAPLCSLHGQARAGEPMTDLAPLPFSASLAEYHALAEHALAALEAGDESVAWRFKWEHPRFRDRQVSAVRTAGVDLDDAKLLVARIHAFDTWDDLATFTSSVLNDRGVLRFEMAVGAV